MLTFLRSAALMGAVFCPAAFAVQSVGLIVSTGKASLVRSGQKAKVSARAGEILFEGDRVEVTSGTTEIYVCSARIQPSLIRAERGVLSVSTASLVGSILAPLPETECLLPDVEKLPAIAALAEGKLPQRDVDEGERRVLAASGPIADSVARLERRIASNPKDLVSRVGRAVLLQRSGLDQVAISEYARLAEDWTGPQWSRHMAYGLYTLHKKAPEGDGRLYALLLGISDYSATAKEIPPLRFAHADAELFARFIASPRARTIAPDTRIVNLTNQQASYSKVRPLLNAFFAQAGQKDSVLVFIAAHGATSGDDGYVVLHDSKPGSFHQNALSMREIRTTLEALASRVARVFLFVDTCHANRIGQIRDFNRAEQQIRENIAQLQNRKIFAFYASNNNQPSYEHERFGGGHGAFTYFLLRALNVKQTDAYYKTVDAVDADGKVSGQEIVDYVTQALTKSTKKQRPQADLRMDDLSFAIAQPGIAMPCCDPFAKQVPAARHSTNRSPVAGIRDPELAEIDLESAMRGAAWHAPAVLDERMRLEEETQRVLLRYLDGDEVPQKRADFADALATTEKLLTLSGPSLYFEARREFFAGRTLLFDRKYEEAASRLENAIRLDPASPYSWNALGIAYLEQGRLGEAENAFLDAIGRARYWAYPRHNLALVYLQRGDYAQVIDTYRTAMRLAPQYSYLPYNLGLVFQKMGLLEQAETQYLDARTKAQWRPQPWIALATLLSELGRDREAERYFAAAAEALHKAPDDTALAALRHNRALYLAKKPSSLAEAETLLEENIAQFEYLPSRFALVQLLASAWRRNRSSPFLLDSAVKSCRVLVSAVPANASARSECADLLLEAKRKPEAVELLRAGLDYAAARQAISQKLRSLSAPQ